MLSGTRTSRPAIGRRTRSDDAGSAGAPAGPKPHSDEGNPTTPTGGTPEGNGLGLRIGDAAAIAGVSARTLRYYEELGLLTPSGHTPGGERRYRDQDLARLDRILELRGVLGMNLDDIKRFLDSDGRLDQIREAYRAKKGLQTKAALREQRALLEEALALNEALAAELDAKLARMDEFRSKLSSSARRCRELLKDLD
jgi:DNA-binding transcriptional MerR regulator